MMKAKPNSEEHDNSLWVRTNLEQDCFPFFSVSLALVLLLGNWFQQESWVPSLGSGWSNFVLESRWWVIFSSLIIHSSKLHFMGNLTLLLFLGFRVEHAIGRAHLFYLCVVCLCLSTVSMWYWGDGEMLVGASSLVFGFWGAQIALGFCFDLSERHEHRYGWWGLFLLAVVFSFQIREHGIGHWTHFSSVLVGGIYVFVLNYRYLVHIFVWFGCTLSLCTALYGKEYFLKCESLTGMDIFIPKDFASWDGYDVRIWFHPFHAQGWLLYGVHEEKELFSWWSKRGFSTQENATCLQTRYCSFYSEEEQSQVRIVHYGRQLYWIGCVHPLHAQIWHTSCSEFLRLVEPKNPDSLEKARRLYLVHPKELYFIENFVIQLEAIGKYAEAIQVLEGLKGTEWEQRANRLVHNIIQRQEEQNK